MFRSSREGPTEGKAGGRTSIWLGTALIAAVGLLLGPLALASSASAATTPHASTTVLGAYVPVTPFRIVDTRTGATDPATYAGKTLAAATSLNVQVTGGVVPAGASGAVLNVTATNTSLPGFLAVYPEGTTQPPLVSNLNFTADETVANLVTVPLSATGMATIYNSAGNTDVLVDVEGYYTSAAPTNGAGLYDSISPVRVLGALAVGATVAPNTTVPVTVAGTTATDGVPASAIAVVVSATAAHGSLASFLSLYPAPAITTVPTFSNVNFSAGEAVANRVTVAVGTGGVIEVYNHTGTVDVDIDVDGYYTGVGGTGSVFVPLTTPIRVADTRTASLVGTETPIPANSSESFLLATAASGIPTTATSVVSNFTVVSGDASGYLSIYPTSTTVHPVSSSVNWTANEIVPDMTIADTNGTGSVEVYNSYGTINLVVDVFGYFETLASGPIMMSAAVTSTQIAITYNEGVSCPSVAANLALAFAYDWTGSASGGAVTGCSTSTTNADVLDLTGTFLLPGSTGGSITYTAGAGRTAVVGDSTSVSVYATSNNASFAATQTLAAAAAAVPAMVSAVETGGTSIAITYNENVSCATGASADFEYYYTGVSGVGATAASCATDVLTLTGTFTVPAADATILYTEPSATVAPLLSSTDAVYATGTSYLYAATQTLPSTGFAPPAMASAVVTATSIAITYNENVTCVPGAVTEAEFAYYSAGTTSGITTLTAASCATDVLTLTGTFALPGTGASIVYTEPASPTTSIAVSATSAYPQFAVTQTLALTSAAAPAMVSAVVNAASIVITYGAAVTCPATGADGAFAYYYQGVNVGGTATSCTTVGDVLTLSGAFAAPGASATIVYTEPATPTTSNAVTATGSTTAFAATQTLAPGTVGAFALAATAPAGSVTAGTSANWTLTATPAITGTFPLTVTGTDAASPNGTAAPAFPATATFNAGGVATVPITMVDAAVQTTGFQFTVSGSASNVLAVVTPIAGAVSTAYIASITTGTCTPTFTAGTFTEPGAPTASATQTLTGSAATGASCHFTANLTAVDAYGNAANAAGSTGTLNTVSATPGNFTVPATATIGAGGVGTLVITPVLVTAFSSALTIGAAAPYNTVVTVSD